MAKIKWAGIVADVTEYQMGELSQKAKKLNMPKSINESMVKALPFFILGLMAAFVCLATRSHRRIPKKS